MGETSAKGNAAAASSIGSTALNAYSSIERGYATAAANEFQAGRAERAAESGKLQAELTDTVMREQLNTTLSNIDVIRAAAGTDPTSATGAAVHEWSTMLSDRQRNASMLNINEQIREDRRSAAYLRKAGGAAIESGYIGAAVGTAGSVLKAVAVA